MKELISKEAAIKTVFSMCCRWDTEDPNDLKLMLMSAFQDLPPVRQWMPTWTPMNERKPNLDERVILQFDWEEPVLLAAVPRELPLFVEAVAWMPLPEPYKGDTTNG